MSKDKCRNLEETWPFSLPPLSVQKKIDRYRRSAVSNTVISCQVTQRMVPSSQLIILLDGVKIDWVVAAGAGAGDGYAVVEKVKDDQPVVEHSEYGDRIALELLRGDVQILTPEEFKEWETNA